MLISLCDNERASAQGVADTYRSLIAQVMVPGDTVSKASRAWKRWAGVSFHESTRTALHSHALDINRRALHHARILRRRLAKRTSH